MEKEYEVTYSYTLDYISWTCPMCETNIEQSGENLWDTTCPECGFEREDTNRETYDETELYFAQED